MWTKFYTILTIYPPRVDNCRHFVHVTKRGRSIDHLPTYFCPRSYWMTPNQWSVNQYLGIGKYLFILQISIMYRFMDNSLISISILSIKKYLLKYWYFQYFTVPFLKSHESFISRVFMKFNTPEASSTHSERLFIGEN